MNENTTTKYPIDFDELDLGDVITAEVIEEAYGISRDDKNYRTKAQLPMFEAVERHFRQLGRIVTVKCSGDDVEILTDEKASPYTHKKFKKSLKQAKKATVQHNSVSVAALSPDLQVRHLRQNSAMNTIISAVHEASDKPLAETKDVVKIISTFKTNESNKLNGND